MIALALLLAVMAVLLRVGHVRGSERRQQEEVSQRLHQADQRIEREFLKTRQQMNDAAGQSWRNIIDGDRG